MWFDTANGTLSDYALSAGIAGFTKKLPVRRMLGRLVLAPPTLETSRPQSRNPYFLLRDADMHSAYLLRRRGWLAGWVSVTRRYCIKTVKAILKLFRPPGSRSPIILVSSDPCADTQFQGEPL